MVPPLLAFEIMLVLLLESLANSERLGLMLAPRQGPGKSRALGGLPLASWGVRSLTSGFLDLPQSQDIVELTHT